MSLAIPVQIVALLPNDNALIEIGGMRKQISLVLVEDVKVGDYVIVHVGYALSRLDPDEAERLLRLFSEIDPE